LPADVRARILASATRLFATQGFDGTAIQEIADAVGIRKPSLLYHFESKDELRQAVLDDVLARWKDTLPSILLAATAGEAQFDAITREIVSFFAEDPDRARLLLREALDRPTEMSALFATHIRPVVANLAVYVRQGQGKGRVWADLDPEAYLFQAIVVLLSGVAFSSSFSELMPARAPEGPGGERLERELLRMAKSSLFAPPRAARRPKLPRARSGDPTRGRRPERRIRTR
jgi:TetR/AcrR family transcriptional regulator